MNHWEARKRGSAYVGRQTLRFFSVSLRAGRRVSGGMPESNVEAYEGRLELGQMHSPPKQLFPSF